jgi:S-DNA-T family DNA segregation ATPase FtsK/SpoIIIE
LESQIERAINFYIGLSIDQREGYALHLAGISGMSIKDFLARVKQYTAPPKQEIPVKGSEYIALAKKLEDAFASFEVAGEVTRIAIGPRLIAIGFAPESERFSKIHKLETDLAHELGIEMIRVFSPFMVKESDCKFFRNTNATSSLIGIEIPKVDFKTISFGEIKNYNKEIILPLYLGLDTIGRPHVVALEDLPHILIAGSTGSGKSSLLHSIICGLLCNASNFRIAMIDTKRVELAVYDENKQMLIDGDIARTKESAEELLAKLEADMRWRYAVLENEGVRNIAEFNKRKNALLPYIVLVIDELADIFFGAKDTAMENHFIKLAQMGRAVGIHNVVATQRPSTDVVTGLVKANFPARISLKLPSQIDSRTILDTPGAEKLCGSGDMFFISPKHAGLMRLHGALVTEQEIHRAIKHYQPNEIYRLPGVKVDKKEQLPSVRGIMREHRMGYERARRVWSGLKKGKRH